MSLQLPRGAAVLWHLPSCCPLAFAQLHQIWRRPVSKAPPSQGLQRSILMGAGPAADGSYGCSCGTNSRHWRWLPQLLHLVAARRSVPRTQAVHGELCLCHAAHAGLCCVLFQMRGRRQCSTTQLEPSLAGHITYSAQLLIAGSPASCKALFTPCLNDHSILQLLGLILWRSADLQVQQGTWYDTQVRSYDSAA